MGVPVSVPAQFMAVYGYCLPYSGGVESRWVGCHGFALMNAGSDHETPAHTKRFQLLTVTTGHVENGAIVVNEQHLGTDWTEMVRLPRGLTVLYNSDS
jgi:hypothetical protein